MADFGGSVQSVGSAVVALLIIVAVVTPIATAAIDLSSPEPVAEDVYLGADGQGETSKDSNIQSFEAEQSLGTAVKFTGAPDSQLNGSAQIQRDDTWTTTTWARLNSTVDQSNATMRVLRLGDWLYLTFDQGQWRVAHYDDSTLNTYVLTANAPHPAANYTHLSVKKNSTTLALYRNNTQVNSTPLSQSSNGDIKNASNLHGRAEETRVLDDPLNSSQRQQLIDRPTAPLKANETARIYYDARADETAIDVYRTGADLQMENVSVVDGFSGEDIQADGLVASGDYNRDGSTVTAVDGGKLDGAPVVFVFYDWAPGQFGDIILNTISLGGSALSLLVVALIMLAMSAVMREFGGGGL